MIGVITARAGSQGVPGKNKALIGGRPLVDYSVSVLDAAPSVTGIILTTDDEDILCFYQGTESVFLVERPPDLATAEANSSDTVAHALDRWQAAGRDLPPTIFLAQPTTPLRTVSDVEQSYALFQRSGNESLISCCLAEGMRHPRDMYRMDSEGCGKIFIEEPTDSHQRSDYERLYQRNGAIYIVTTEYFRRTGRLRSESPTIYEMPWERSINIDIPGDMLIAKALIESGLIEQEKGVE